VASGGGQRQPAVSASGRSPVRPPAFSAPGGLFAAGFTYNGGLQVHSVLLSVLLRDEAWSPGKPTPGAPCILDGLHCLGGIVSVLVVVTYVMVCATGSPGPVVARGRMETIFPITRSAGTCDFSLST
jgi:hypothetical protein